MNTEQIFEAGKRYRLLINDVEFVGEVEAISSDGTILFKDGPVISNLKTGLIARILGAFSNRSSTILIQCLDTC
jgi:hypothetical protein